MEYKLYIYNKKNFYRIRIFNCQTYQAEVYSPISGMWFKDTPHIEHNRGLMPEHEAELEQTEYNLIKAYPELILV